MIVKIIKAPSLIRSATAPETIVAAVAANIPWNKKSVQYVYPSLYVKSKAPSTTGELKPNPANPINPAASFSNPGYIKLNPTRQYSNKPTQMMNTFLKRILIVFF